MNSPLKNIGAFLSLCGEAGVVEISSKTSLLVREFFLSHARGADVKMLSFERAWRNHVEFASLLRGPRRTLRLVSLLWHFRW